MKGQTKTRAEHKSSGKLKTKENEKVGRKIIKRLSNKKGKPSQVKSTKRGKETIIKEKKCMQSDFAIPT
jgi:hypothetical protein